MVCGGEPFCGVTGALVDELAPLSGALGSLLNQSARPLLPAAPLAAAP